jgi:hypothetical protein
MVKIQQQVLMVLLLEQRHFTIKDADLLNGVQLLKSATAFHQS